MTKRPLPSSGIGLVGGFVVLCIWLAPMMSQAPAARPPRSVTFLHLNDVYEITPVAGGRSGGLARVAALRAQLQRTHAALITDLAGDFLSPSAMGLAVVDGRRLAGRQMVAVLNATGLDWATLGNHEFDLEPAEFLARLAESHFRYVVSNVTDSAGRPFPRTVRHAVLRLRTPGGPVRLGLIGLVINSNQPPWARFEDPIVSARREVAALRDSVDGIVALTHLELATDETIAEAVPEIALILGGHEHENYLIRRGSTFTPIVKADANVRSVAVVTLSFGCSRCRPVVTSRLITVDSTIAASPTVAAEVARWVVRVDSGYRAQGLDPHAVVATLREPLDAREAIVRNRPAPVGALIAEALRAEVSDAEVGVMNGGSIRIDDVLPAGPLTQYDVVRLLPFGGNIVGVTMTGALLQRVLEQGEANRGTGGFLQLAGATRSGVHWLINGQPVDPARNYRVATTDFLVTGKEVGLGYLVPGNPELGPIKSYRDIRIAVIDHLRAAFRTR